MPMVHLSGKRQLTIPSAMALQAGIRPHDTLWIDIVGDEIRIRKAPEHPTDYFAGRLSAYFRTPQDADTWLREEREAWTNF